MLKFLIFSRNLGADGIFVTQLIEKGIYTKCLSQIPEPYKSFVKFASEIKPKRYLITGIHVMQNWVVSDKLTKIICMMSLLYER